MDSQHQAIGGGFSRYLPAVVSVFGLAITIIVWRGIDNHENVQVRWATELAAEAIKTDLREDMEWQRIGLDRLALLWEAAEPAQRLWTRNAELYIQHRPGCLAVEWIPIDSEQPVLVASSRLTPPLAFGGVPKEAMRIAKDSGQTVFSAPAAIGDGSTQWAVVHPVYVKNQLQGFVISFFDAVRSLTENLLDVRGLGFSYTVALPGAPEYKLPGTDPEHERDWGMTVPVPLSGISWQLRVWPTPSALNRIRSVLPQVALTLGAVLSLLLGLTLHFGLRAARSSAHIVLANEALRREIAVREGAEKELRRARDDLDVRVQERTAELASTNLILQKELAEHEHAEHTLRELAGRLFHLQDEEKRRLARELHDGATQDLVALNMNMAVLREAVGGGDTSTRTLVSDCTRLAQHSMEELRTMSYLLHPPLLTELGLTPALCDFVEGFATRSQIQVTVSIDPELGRLGQELELTIFRVVQEALSNIHRHAQSRTAMIALVRHPDFVRLEVTDAGRGIAPEILAENGSKLVGVGIAGMRERVRLMGGRLEIHTGKNGTTVDVALPLVVGSQSTRKSVASSTFVLPCKDCAVA